MSIQTPTAQLLRAIADSIEAGNSDPRYATHLRQAAECYEGMVVLVDAVAANAREEAEIAESQARARKTARRWKAATSSPEALAEVARLDDLDQSIDSGDMFVSDEIINDMHRVLINFSRRQRT